MKIAIDGRFFGTAGGFGRYTAELIKHLEKIDQDNEYLIFLTRQNFDLYEPANTKFKKVLADCRWYTFKEQLVMPWKIWRAEPDLVHFVSWNVPLLNPAKFIVTVHDLILLKYPSRKASTLNPLLYHIKNLAYRLTLKRALRRAQKIIAVSEFTKKDIIDNFQIDPSKIEVIHEAAGARASGDEKDTTEPAPIGVILKKYGVIKPFFLYVGVAYPHKNLDFLVQAFQIFFQKYSSDYQLALVGEENYFYKRLKKKISHLEHGENSPPNPNEDISTAPRDDTYRANMVFTGLVPDEELITFYTHASLYIFPSLYEGFGLPPLEAMGFGLPVLASNNSCLPEILGDAAAFFNPQDSEELAALINRVLTDRNLRNKMRRAGLNQVKKYSWTAMAQKTLQVYPAGQN